MCGDNPTTLSGVPGTRSIFRIRTSAISPHYLSFHIAGTGAFGVSSIWDVENYVGSIDHLLEYLVMNLIVILFYFVSDF